MKTAQKIIPLYKAHNRSKIDLENRVQALESRLNLKKTTLVYPVENGLMFLDQAHIVRCEASSNYTHILLITGEKKCISKCLKWVEDRLDNSEFIRVHNSHLIQIKQIKKYIKGSLPAIELINGEMIPVARSKKTLIYNTFLN